jgi:hypothetical protein
VLQLFFYYKRQGLNTQGRHKIKGWYKVLYLQVVFEIHHLSLLVSFDRGNWNKRSGQMVAYWLHNL